MARYVLGRAVTSHLLPTYARVDLAFERGEGAWLVTPDGERYLDFAAGVAVNSLGHAHPHRVKALTEQAAKLWHVSNLYRIPEGERLAARLCAGAGCRVVCVALEYAFWVDKRPEVFLRVEPCVAETPTSMTSWHRSLTRAMQRNGAALAELVAARDPSAFTCLEGGEAPRIHPVYDALLALRGQRRALDERGDGRETREPRP